MRRQASVFLVLVLLVCGIAASVIAQQQHRGRVVNRDSVPQKCQVEFFVGTALQFGVASDDQGYFYLANPREGSYRVIVSRGQAREEFAVNIDRAGLHPSTLVVRW